MFVWLHLAQLISRVKERVESNTCFICELSKAELERNGIEFRIHNKSVHNVMKYVDYYLTLLEKRSSEFTGSEQMIWNQIQSRNFDWVPNGTTLELAESGEQEDENIGTALKTEVWEPLKKLIEANRAQVDKMLKSIQDRLTQIERKL